MNDFPFERFEREFYLDAEKVDEFLNRVWRFMQRGTLFVGERDFDDLPDAVLFIAGD